ncbi:hypothetical protein FRB94_013147 [Tulasnella sp. JGI-2019a]|nr:hypothetical protein FRB94_013147 [Tulasnella sp. JGI-2019a]
MTPAGTGNPVPPACTAPTPLRMVDIFTQLEPSGASHLNLDHDMQPQDGSPRPSRSHLPTTCLGLARDGALDIDLDLTPLPRKEKRTFLVATDSPSFKASANAKSRKTGKGTAKTTLSAEDYEKLAEERKLNVMVCCRQPLISVFHVILSRNPVDGDLTQEPATSELPELTELTFQELSMTSSMTSSEAAAPLISSEPQ